MTSNMRIKHELMKDNEQLVSRSINNGNENGGVNGQSAVEIHSFPSFRNGNIWSTQCVFFHVMNYWRVTKLGISMISTISKSESRLAKIFSNESTNKNPMWARIFTCFMWSDQANDNQIYPLLGWNIWGKMKTNKQHLKAVLVQLLWKDTTEVNRVQQIRSLFKIPPPLQSTCKPHFKLIQLAPTCFTSEFDRSHHPFPSDSRCSKKWPYTQCGQAQGIAPVSDRRLVITLGLFDIVMEHDPFSSMT